jgi:hypothetical protein
VNYSYSPNLAENKKMMFFDPELTGGTASNLSMGRV